ncbi:hypothetical protein [Brevundimonas sp. FT23028]|uniref:hypothetical protein n=1 Tax=Brevundimonas sp. FT23028 TaxID=3393748 RepID=UPI003B585CB7
MGLFNNLMIETASGPVEVQFKWGFVRLLDYKIGDTLKWFDFPKPDCTPGRVEISGIGVHRSGDPDTRTFSYYRVIIENDILTGCEPIPETEWLAMKDPSFRD